MHRQLISLGLLCTVGLLTSGYASTATAAEDEDADSILPLNKKKKKSSKKDPFAEQKYRYDFEDRHLTFGVNVGGGLGQGITLNAFPYGGSITPYFKGAFGDGNAIEVDLTVGFNPLIAQNAEWLFFRTPILDGSLAYGYVGFFAPTVAFKYELEMGSSISRKSKLLSFGGLGLGPAFTYGIASLTENGAVADTNLTNTQIFFDVVPTFGLKARLGEFGYVEVGARIHVLFEVAAKLNEADSFETGTPEVIEEFWIGNSRYLDVFFGFSYDFG